MKVKIRIIQKNLEIYEIEMPDNSNVNDPNFNGNCIMTLLSLIKNESVKPAKSEIGMCDFLDVSLVEKE